MKFETTTGACHIKCLANSVLNRTNMCERKRVNV